MNINIKQKRIRLIRLFILVLCICLLMTVQTVPTFAEDSEPILDLGVWALFLHPGENEQLSFTYEDPSDPTKVLTASWKSNDTSIARVSVSGKVTAKRAGICKITCKVGNASKKVVVYVFPAKVVGLKVKKKASTAVWLKWRSQDNITKYHVYRVYPYLDEYYKIKSVKGSLNIAKIDRLKKGKTYYFAVQAYKRSSGWGDISKIIKVKL